MTILVIGSSGQLGKCLYDKLYKIEEEVIFINRAQLDVCSLEAIINIFKLYNPTIVINASAYTLVDDAEDNAYTANLINNIAVKNIADQCFIFGSKLIHFSTDYVFDGKASVPYKEDSKINPISIYGKTKYYGEEAIKKSNCQYLIFRTSWVFSEYGNNFLKTILKHGSNKEELNIVADQFGCPTYAQDIAISIRHIIISIKKTDFESGIYNYCGDDICSWHDFAIHIFHYAAQINIKVPNKIFEIKSSEFKTKAPRPMFSALDCSKLNCEYGLTPSDWKKGLISSIDKLVLNNEI